MSRTQFRLLASIGIVISTLLRWLVPLNPNYGAVHDDELMVRMASNILKGNWIGNYPEFGHLLLSKPAGYPMFLAWSHFLPWAPTVTTHLLLLLGITICAAEFRILGVTRGRVCAFLYLAAFLPQWFESQMSRVYRDGFLVSLTFIGIALALRLGRLLPTFFLPQKISSALRIQILILIFANGFCLSWYVITKPSWYPLAIVMLLLSLRSLRREHFQARKNSFKQIGLVSVTALVGLLPMIEFVKHQNERHFGINAIDSFSSGSFPVAMQTWSSVQSGQFRKYVLLSQSQREAVYKVSPTARKLKPFLELPWGNGWRGSACSSPLAICDESAAWFPWDLRDAMNAAGLDTSAKQFESSFAKLNMEIQQACKSKQLMCGGGGIAPGVRSFKEISKRDFVEAYAISIDWLLFAEHQPHFPTGKIPPENAFAADWKSAIRNLPLDIAPSTYRPESSSLGATVSLLSKIYGLIWPGIIVLAVVCFLLSVSRLRLSEWVQISFVLLIGVLAFIGQLALLESSSGMYLTAGKSLYLLPALPFLMVFSFASLATLGQSDVFGVEKMARHRSK